MARLMLVRHGEASAGWGDHADPGLSVLGRRQADAVAQVLAAEGPMPILVSPLRRTLETAVRVVCVRPGNCSRTVLAPPAARSDSSRHPSTSTTPTCSEAGSAWPGYGRCQ